MLRLISLWCMAIQLPIGMSGCSERARAGRSGVASWLPGRLPDELPQIVNAELPFRYPIPQYLRRVQGNVLLRLYVDANGQVIQDSTRIMESSGEPAFDAAALAGALALHFQPARRRDTPIPVSLLFPVHFRHPEAPPFPGDSG
jgi:TonB family protein